MERIPQILFELVGTATTSITLGPAGSGEIPQEYNAGRSRMTSHHPESVALTLVAAGKEIPGR